MDTSTRQTLKYKKKLVLKPSGPSHRTPGAKTTSHSPLLLKRSMLNRKHGAVKLKRKQTQTLNFQQCATKSPGGCTVSYQSELLAVKLSHT